MSEFTTTVGHPLLPPVALESVQQAIAEVKAAEVERIRAVYEGARKPHQVEWAEVLRRAESMESLMGWLPGEGLPFAASLGLAERDWMTPPPLELKPLPERSAPVVVYWAGVNA